MSISNFTLENKKIVFKTIIPVMVNHLNYGNHLGYDSMLSIIQEARIRFLKQLQLTETSIEGDVGYLVTNVDIKYNSESFHGDELKVELFISKINSTLMELYSVVENNTTTKRAASCITRHLFYNYKTKKLSKITEETTNLLLGVTV